ncbi:MAG: potassium channel family protein [Burkholderiaceae bacterium]|jgi:hypothetical protein|nr:potassium channel family protein [Burkholderiaceae bacterium]
MGLSLALVLPMVLVTTLVHYEVLRGLSRGLPRLHIVPRLRLVFVIVGAFVAHVVQIALYGLVYWALGGGVWDLPTSLYLSAQSFTSLGFGDVVPPAALHPLVAMETLNGLLLIAWTASFTYLSMERYWKQPERR